MAAADQVDRANCAPRHPRATPSPTKRRQSEKDHPRLSSTTAAEIQGAITMTDLTNLPDLTVANFGCDLPTHARKRTWA